MPDTVQVVYWGPLEVKRDLATGITFRRGEPTEVPVGERNTTLNRLLGEYECPKPQPHDADHREVSPREFYKVSETIDEHTRAMLERLYQDYPDREIEAHKDHAKEYERVAWSAWGDEKAKESRRAGAMGEVEKAEKAIVKFQDMKRERLNAGAIVVEAEPVRRGRRTAEAG